LAERTEVNAAWLVGFAQGFEKGKEAGTVAALNSAVSTLSIGYVRPFEAQVENVRAEAALQGDKLTPIGLISAEIGGAGLAMASTGALGKVGQVIEFSQGAHGTVEGVIDTADSIRRGDGWGVARNVGLTAINVLGATSAAQQLSRSSKSISKELAAVNQSQVQLPQPHLPGGRKGEAYIYR
jgi:hypothetical protein